MTRRRIQATGIYVKRLRETGDLPQVNADGKLVNGTRAGELDVWKKRPQPCAYGCSRSVYTVYSVAMCNICRRERNIPVWNE